MLEKSLALGNVFKQKKGVSRRLRFGMENMNRCLVECVVVAEKVNGIWKRLSIEQTPSFVYWDGGKKQKQSWSENTSMPRGVCGLIWNRRWTIWWLVQKELLMLSFSNIICLGCMTLKVRGVRSTTAWTPFWKKGKPFICKNRGVRKDCLKNATSRFWKKTKKKKEKQSDEKQSRNVYLKKETGNSYIKFL